MTNTNINTNTNAQKYVNTNIGLMPLDTYLEIRSQQYGYSSYEELCKAGYSIEVKNVLTIAPNGKPQRVIV